MAFKPLYDRVVVRRIDADKTTQGGIIIPDKSAEKPTQGEVIAVGPGALTDQGQLRALSVNVGDTVLFSQYGGTTVKLAGEELLVLRESDILAIIEQTDSQEKAA